MGLTPEKAIQTIDHEETFFHCWIHENFYLVGMKFVLVCQLFKNFTISLNSRQITVHLSVLTIETLPLLLYLIEADGTAKYCLFESRIYWLLVIGLLLVQKLSHVI